MPQPRTQPTKRKFIYITNNNFMNFKIPPYKSLNIRECLPAMIIIARQMNLRLNRNDNLTIVKAVLNRMILEN